MVLVLIAVLLALVLSWPLFAAPGYAVQNITVSPSSNRLNFPGTHYDAGGNLHRITLAGETSEYVFDSANMMKSLRTSDDQARVFIYNADDERVLTFDCAGLGDSCPATIRSVQ